MIEIEDPQKTDDEVEALEVWGVVDINKGGEETQCEQVSATDPREPEFWSIYRHIPGHGCEVDDDFPTKEAAIEAARLGSQMFGIPAFDYTVWPYREIV